MQELASNSCLLFYVGLVWQQVSLPKGKGVKLTILEERAAKAKKAANN